MLKPHKIFNVPTKMVETSDRVVVGPAHGKLYGYIDYLVQDLLYS